jgi:hypothetical protein
MRITKRIHSKITITEHSQRETNKSHIKEAAQQVDTNTISGKENRNKKVRLYKQPIV